MPPSPAKSQPADFERPADLTILQYPLWYPLAERFRHLPGRRVFYYHGVTDPALLGDAPSSADDRAVLRNSLARSELCHHADRVVCTSPFTAQELHAHSGYPLDRIDLLPPAVDLAALQPRAKPLDAQPTTLLFVGRIAAHKRLDLAIDALAALAPTHPKLRLLLVGDYGSPAALSLQRSLGRQARRRGVADRVTFTGQVDSVAPYFAQADLYVQPSDHEGFGVPLVEAMAVGLPVVASASGAMPWVLDAETSAEAGLLFAPGDANSLRTQIERLLEDDGLRAQLREAGYRRAQHFALDAFASQARSLVADVLSSEPAKSPAASDLLDLADTAYRDYRVRSGLPLVGPLLAWLRRQSTTHVKEAYLDRVIEQQVNYNRRLASEIERAARRSRRAQAAAAAGVADAHRPLQPAAGHARRRRTPRPGPRRVPQPHPRRDALCRRCARHRRWTQRYAAGRADAAGIDAGSRGLAGPVATARRSAAISHGATTS